MRKEAKEGGAFKKIKKVWDGRKNGQEVEIETRSGEKSIKRRKEDQKRKGVCKFIR